MNSSHKENMLDNGDAKQNTAVIALGREIQKHV